MQKTERNLTLLRILAVSALIMSNVLTVLGKIPWFTINLPYFGETTVSSTFGLFTYPIIFLCTDIISQIWGRKEAQKTVWYGFYGQVVAMLMIACPYLFVWLGAPVEMTQGFKDISAVGWATVGSLLAYVAAQSWDVFAFHKIQDFCENKIGEGFNKHRWIWNNLSTLSSQVIDTVIVSFVLFYIGLGFDLKTVVGLCIGKYLWKGFCAVLDTPFFYLATRGYKDNEDRKLRKLEA